MSFGKTIKRAILGPGDFEKILVAEQEIFNDIQTFEDKKVINEKMRTLKFQLEDVASRTSEKNAQKRQYLQSIYDGLLAILEGKTYKGYNLTEIGKQLSAARNLSNTTTRSRKLLNNVSSYTMQLDEKLKKIEAKKLKELSERPQKNRERAQKILKKVLIYLGLPEKNSYTNVEQKRIGDLTRLRETAKQQLGFTEETIEENPEFEDFVRLRMEAISATQPSALAMPTPRAAGTGLKGGRKTRKQRRSRKARKGKSRKH